MTQTIEISTHLPAAPDLIWKQVCTSRLLTYVTHPLIEFRPIEPRSFPAEWAEGDYQTEMRLFGIFPIGRQTIGIRYPEELSSKRLILRDDGHGASAKVWDHYIFVESDGNQGTKYTDRVTIDAGRRTPFVTAFAWIFYSHRQRRWRRLVQSKFADLTDAASDRNVGNPT